MAQISAGPDNPLSPSFASTDMDAIEELTAVNREDALTSDCRPGCQEDYAGAVIRSGRENACGTLVWLWSRKGITPRLVEALRTVRLAIRMLATDSRDPGAFPKGVCPGGRQEQKRVKYRGRTHRSFAWTCLCDACRQWRRRSGTGVEIPTAAAEESLTACVPIACEHLDTTTVCQRRKSPAALCWTEVSLAALVLI
ncbi:hypothetical protein BD310DRAFT_264449 [Dichomitus squalens]|uniref:Uncharacterized protein n=1 Tax=Dichomitus squalens TaxID=114155 RepID=A0A4Q9PG17_9APHY|nr:hypothetical protein BD310DRAFT_264449 [Dichomitus squalens]